MNSAQLYSLNPQITTEPTPSISSSLVFEQCNLMNVYSKSSHILFSETYAQECAHSIEAHVSFLLITCLVPVLADKGTEKGVSLLLPSVVGQKAPESLGKWIFKNGYGSVDAACICHWAWQRILRSYTRGVWGWWMRCWCIGGGGGYLGMDSLDCHSMKIKLIPQS